MGNPSKRHTPATQELRQFGLIFSALLLALFAGLIPWLLGRAWPLWPWMLAAPIVGLALLLPRALHPLYRFWMAFGAVAGWINTRLILGLLFFLMVLPIGLLMRLLRGDPLRRRLQPEVESYRVDQPAQPPEHVEKPY